VTRLLVAATVIIGLFVTQPPSPASAKRITGPCDQETVHDARNDGPIDIVSIQLTSDCQSFQYTLTTRRPFTDRDLGHWGIRIGPGNACDGMENEVVVRPDPSTGELIGNIYGLSLILGDPCAWRVIQGSVSVERLSPRSIRATVRVPPSTLPNRDGFRWLSYTTHATKAKVDVAPRFVVQALPTPRAPRVEGWTYDHTPSMEIEWGTRELIAVDRFEFQYRRVGGRWSDIQRAEPRETRAVVRDLSYDTFEVRVRVISLSRTGAWGTARVRLCPKTANGQPICG
jgi:hypothetical protein